MNLLFLDSIEKETYGGMEEWIRLVASGMRERGHAVTVAGRKGSEFLRRVGESNSRMELLPLDISGDFQPFTIAAIKRHFESRQVDAVIVNFNKDVRLGGLAAKLKGSTRVIWSLGLDITRDSLVHRTLTPMLIDGVIVPSHALKNQITRHGYLTESIIEVIPIGIPDVIPPSDMAGARADLLQRHALPPDSVLAVTVGRFVNQKGHTYLLEALPELVRSHPHVQLLWLGSGPLEADLRAKAKKLGVDSHVIFAGMLDSVERELAAADLMVHPSIEEPFGIAVLEGMRAGLPVVACKVGGLPEVLDDRCAVFVEPKDSQALAMRVSGLLGDRDRMKAMGKAARERFLQHFKLDDMCDHIERYLSGVLQMERHHGQA